MTNPSNQSKIIPLSSNAKNVNSGEATESTAFNAEKSDSNSQYDALFSRMSANHRDFQQRSVNTLLDLLQAAFDSMDDALFDLAEKAVDNAEQNRFFESMREVRLKRQAIESGFAKDLTQGFVKSLVVSSGAESGDELAPHSAKLNSTIPTLTIMADDSVEEMVAIDAMVAKAEQRWELPIKSLGARLDHLVVESKCGKTNFEQTLKDHPLGPQKVCRVFADNCQQLAIEIKARLVVFKLFDKHLVDRLGEFYESSNKQLLVKGVLPNYERTQKANSRVKNLSNTFVPRQSGTGAHRRLDNESLDGQYAGHQAMGVQDALPLSLLQQLSAGNMGVQFSALQPLCQMVSELPVSDAPAIDQNALIGLLSQLSQRQIGFGSSSFAPLTAYSQLFSPATLATDLRQSMSHYTAGADSSIGNRDRDTINLVAVLFQFLLDDRNLAEPIKAVVSNLQVPIIQLALQNEQFFKDSHHPARRLLNEMTRAAVGWTQTESYLDDPFYQSICEATDRICTQYKGDSALFSEVLADFLSFIGNESKKMSLRSKRIVDAETGRDNAANARKYVDALVASRQLEKLPEFIGALIESDWKNVLFLAYLNHGLESAEWCSVVKTMDQLIWSVSPARSLFDRSEILSCIPSVLEDLRNGLNSVSCDAYSLGEFFDKLEALHMDIMQRSAPLGGNSSNDSTLAVNKELSALHQDEQKNQEGLNDQDIAAGKPEKKHALDPIIIDSAEAMQVGQWVELVSANEKQRCRLVAVLPNSGKRIFVTRAGLKVGEYDVLELAQKITLKELALLEDAQLFDKALSSVIEGLRQSKVA